MENLLKYLDTEEGKELVLAYHLEANTKSIIQELSKNFKLRTQQIHRVLEIAWAMGV